VCLSGDGTLHEVFNGLAAHARPRAALRVPVVPVPTGSGNGMALNLLGSAAGLDISSAALNAVKGAPMPLDLFSVALGGERHVSFMSQCVGLMADLDLGTEHLRWLGSSRFVLGFLHGGPSALHRMYRTCADSERAHQCS
jgi:sphingosine kinase